MTSEGHFHLSYLWKPFWDPKPSPRTTASFLNLASIVALPGDDLSNPARVRSQHLSIVLHAPTGRRL